MKITTRNIQAKSKFKSMMIETMGMPEIKRYYNEFKGKEYDFNIFQYGCLDCYDYDLYKTLVEIGINTKPITEYTKVLDFGCTYKHRENLRNVYKKLVHDCTIELIKEFEGR